MVKVVNAKSVTDKNVLLSVFMLNIVMLSAVTPA
jgi:hypothetical protein